MKRETVVYKTVAGVTIEADVYGASTGERKPVVVWIHGGALMIGNRRWIGGGQVPELVNRGYAVVSIDYRLAPETRLPGIIEDLKDAIAWVRGEGASRFGFDPTRLAVMGGSAGGYLTLMTGIAVEPRPQLLVSYYGYGDIVGEWYSRPDPFYCQQPEVSEEEARAGVGTSPLTGSGSDPGRSKFYLFCRQKGRWPKEVAGWEPEKNPEAFLPYCPAKKVDEDYPPTFLLHGDADTDVPVEQSRQMAAALDQAGVDHRLVVVPQGAHGFDTQRGGLKDPENRALFDQVLEFMAEHLETNRRP